MDEYKPFFWSRTRVPASGHVRIIKLTFKTTCRRVTTKEPPPTSFVLWSGSFVNGVDSRCDLSMRLNHCDAASCKPFRSALALWQCGHSSLHSHYHPQEECRDSGPARGARRAEERERERERPWGQRVFLSVPRRERLPPTPSRLWLGGQMRPWTHGRVDAWSFASRFILFVAKSFKPHMIFIKHTLFRSLNSITGITAGWKRAYDFPNNNKKIISKASPALDVILQATCRWRAPTSDGRRKKETSQARKAEVFPFQQSAAWNFEH